MIKVAIVGNIACGKSTAEKYIESKGYPVLDTDKVCHSLLQELPEVKTAFNNYEVFENGAISRDKLGRLVFDNPVLKAKLENILYPEVTKEILKFFGNCKNSKYAFVSAPQLFEAEMENLFDKIMFIYCDDEIRLSRLLQRNSYSREYAKTRMNAQQNQNLKAQKSDWVIYNNSSVEDLYKAINEVIG